MRLQVWLRPYRAPEVKVDVELTIPADLPPGPVTVLVGGADAATAEESGFRRGGSEAHSVEQLIGEINRNRPSDRVYYQLSRADEGAVYGGHPMPSLPPSVIDVLRAEATSGETQALRRTLLLEGSEAVAYVVSGEHRIELSVRR